MKILLFVVSCFLGFNAFSQVEVRASVTLNPAGDFVATIKSNSGQAFFDNQKLTIPNLTLDLNTLVTGLSLRDDHAKNKYLEVKKYPTAILSDIKAENGKGVGLLQIRDKKAKVSGTYKFSADQKQIVAEFKIKLSDFGIEDINYKGIGVEDEVAIEARINVTKANSLQQRPAANRKK